jgi:hypothetical protein
MADPEFETFTYGDPPASKPSLQKLKPGDFLVFYVNRRFKVRHSSARVGQSTNG